MEGVWCEWAENDSLALDRMLKAQQNQILNPVKGTSQSAWSNFIGFLKKLFGLK